MIATTRGLVVLALIALALAVLAMIAGPSDEAPRSHLLVPSFDETKVTAIDLSWGQVGHRIQRVGDQWRINQLGLAEASTIDAMFTALRGARWHRRRDRASVPTPRGPLSPPTLTIGDMTLAIGPPIAGLDQTWIFRGRDAYLVDSWVAKALVPDLMALRARHPLACASSTIAAELPDLKLRIEGTRLVQPSALWLDERWLQSVADACAAVELVAFDGTRDGRAGIEVIADGEVREVGNCANGRVLVETGAGTGCVEAAALRALADVLRDPQPDLRPLPIEPAKLVLPDGNLDVTANRIGDTDADPERVRELISALMTRGAAKPRPAAKPRATITATDRAGTEIVLELFDRAIARPGEPIAIEIPPDAWKIITRPSAALKDPIRWREDATNISAVTLDNITYKRGAVLGEWMREPAGKVDATLVGALVETLATVRAPTALAPTAIAHRLRLTITPPTGAPIVHAIDLAAPTQDGCAARIDRAPVLLPLPLCTAVIALAAQH